MEYLRSAFYFIAVLSVLVLVHEWGHFIVAKLCGMHVKDFSLFFGKRLIRLGERNGTEYNIRMIPLGGFVSIVGMEPEDISNGAPIFPKKTEKQKQFHKVMAGLTTEALEGVNFNYVSERIGQAATDAVDDKGELTEEGRREMTALLNTTGLTVDEHQYLEAILTAQALPPDPNGYNQKPLWQRAATIFAGPFMSIAFGYLLFCGMGLTTGLPYDDQLENVVEVVMKDTPASRAGLLAGDKIIQIENVKITEGHGMVDMIHANPGKLLHITVLRDGETKMLTVIPKAQEGEALVNNKIVKVTQGMIGFQPHDVMLWRKYSFTGAVGKGSDAIKGQLEGIKKTFTSPKEAKENVGGPVAIASIIHQQSKLGPRNILLVAAMLSVSLGIMNLLPIPILDGGHLMLLAYEGIRRRKLSSREVNGAQMVGLAIILTLFVLVMFNDIARAFHG